MFHVPSVQLYWHPLSCSPAWCGVLFSQWDCVKNSLTGQLDTDPQINTSHPTCVLYPTAKSSVELFAISPWLPQFLSNFAFKGTLKYTTMAHPHCSPLLWIVVPRFVIFYLRTVVRWIVMTSVWASFHLEGNCPLPLQQPSLPLNHYIKPPPPPYVR